MKHRGSLPLALALAGTLGAAPALLAQDVSYTTVSEVELGGPMGAMASMFGGDLGSQETTHISGAMIRTDSEHGSSMIVDVAEGRFISLDHDNRSYSVMTLEGMQSMLQGEGGGGAGDQPAQGAQGGEEDPEVTVTFDLEDTGETRTIQGMEARRFFMTAEVEGAMEPMGTGQDAEAMEEQSFRMVYFSDMWMTDEIPLPEEMSEATREMVESWGSEGGMAQAFASNPNVQVAMEESREEMASMGGTALESTTYMVMLPVDAEFDREAVLVRADQPLSQGLDLGELMSGAAGEAAKNALGGLGGLFGGGDEEDEEAEEEGMPPPENGQLIFMRMKTTLTDFQETDLPDSLFEIPEGYTETSPPGMGG